MNASQKLIAQPISYETGQRLRARLVQLFSAAVILHYGLLQVGFAVVSDEASGFSTLLYGAFVVVGFAMWLILASLNIVRTATIGLVVSLILLNLLASVPQFFYPFVAMVAITTLIQDWRAFSVAVIALFSIIIGQIINITGSEMDVLTALNQIGIVFSLATIGIGVRYFANALRRAMFVAEEDANLLQFAAEAGQMSMGITHTDELLTRSVDFIKDRFGYYHVQLFLVDEQDEVAWLRASTGEAGQHLLARKHHLDVGSNSLVGRVTQSGNTVTNRKAESDRVAGDLLPLSEVEVGLPLRDGDRVIGVLNVHSEQRESFRPGEVQALQITANLITASIKNATAFSEQISNVHANQRLFLEAEAKLREIQRLNRSLTRDSWMRFTEMGDMKGVVLDGGASKRIDEWSDLSMEAGRNRQILTRKDGDSWVVAVPVVLRGEVIGTIEVETAPNADEIDTREITHAVSERLAISIDNARLFEDARDTTLYEQQVNRIVSQYQSLNTVEDLLQVTLKELGDTLGAESSSIRLSSIELDELGELPEAPLATDKATDK